MEEAPAVAELGITSGDALLVFDDELTIQGWNRAAERLTGIPAEEAIGRPCWEIVGAVDDHGATVCHGGCSEARLAREGWPVGGRELLVRTATGRTRVALSTIALDGETRRFLHLLRDATPQAAEHDVEPATLTPRQTQVLELMAEGVSATAMAARLGIAVPTVRNHVRAVLVELGAHSQLEAVALARRRRLLSG
jgi:PAS domain S-box-containing protein